MKNPLSKQDGFFRQEAAVASLQKKGWQDCTCYLKPPPFQFYNTNAGILKFNPSSTIPHCIRALFEIANATHTRENTNLTCLCR